MVPKAKAERRRHISLSMAGHCRMELWLIEQGREPDPHTPAVLRLFEYGDLLEWLLFNPIQIVTADGVEEMGDWLKWADVIEDPVTGFAFDPTKVAITHRQKEVAIRGGKRALIGHIDGMFHTQNGEWLLVDAKSANAFSFQRILAGNLEDNVFSRELVVTQNMYQHALREEGFKLERGILLYVSKEKATLACRVINYDPAMVAEGSERLLAGLRDDPPEPDYPWLEGRPIDLRCGYCDMKTQCAAMRGFTLEFKLKQMGASRKEQPVWIPKKGSPPTP